MDNVVRETAAAPKVGAGSDVRVETTFDALVLGAGISGLVAASILLQQGCERVLLVDEYDHVGGNHIDRTIGGYTFDVGSLIFQDDSPLLRHFPELLAHYVPIDPTWGRLNPQGVITRYPLGIKEDLVDAGPVEWCRIVSSVLISRLFRRKLRNARDFAQHWIGARLTHRSGLLNYMERFYGVAPERIDVKFAEKRMLWIKQHSLLRTHLSRLANPAKDAPANKQLARPKRGFAQLYRPAAERLAARGADIRLGLRSDGLWKSGPNFVLAADGRSFTAARVVSTIPLDRIQQLCGLASDDRLQTVTMISLFFSFSGERGFPQSVLYNFSSGGAWKRLTVYSDFYGRANGREYFAAEVNAEHVAGSVERAERDFREHVAANGLFDGDLVLEGSHILTNAYPVYTDNADERVKRAIAALRAFGVESLGRQGGFDYQPTARQSTVNAEAVLGFPAGVGGRA